LARPVLEPGVEFPLLEGEAESGDVDAAHWVAVYEQLISFCRSVLAEDDGAAGVDRGDLRRRLRAGQPRSGKSSCRRQKARQLDFADLG